MISNKKFNTFYKIGNIKLEEGKIFKKNYNKLYDKEKNIAKDHYLLSNAFNITRLIKRNNNIYSNEIPEENYLDNNKEKYKLNIYNYKNILGNINNKKGSTNEDEVIKTLLIKIDEKNIEELLKDKEKLMNLQKKTLKGLSHKIEPSTTNNTLWKTFNKTSSIESVNNRYNQSNYKSNKSKLILILIVHLKYLRIIIVYQLIQIQIM